MSPGDPVGPVRQALEEWTQDPSRPFPEFVDIEARAKLTAALHSIAAAIAGGVDLDTALALAREELDQVEGYRKLLPPPAMDARDGRAMEGGSEGSTSA